MKTTLLILFLTGCGLWAQTPPAGDTSDSARDQILRDALRQAMAETGATNAAPAAVVTTPAATNHAVVKPVKATNTVAVAKMVQHPAAPAVPAAAAPADNYGTELSNNVQRSALAQATQPAGEAASQPAMQQAGQPTNQPVPPPVQPEPAPAAAETSPPAAPTPEAVNPVPAILPAHRPMSPFGPMGMPGPGGSPAVVAAPLAVPVMPVAPTVTAAPSAPPPMGAPAPQAMPPVRTRRPATAIPPPGGWPEDQPNEEVLAAGVINFPATDVNQVLDIYAALVKRTILRPTALPASVITIKTMTPLTKTEAIAALDTVLAMNGITMINVGDKFVKAVPVGQAFQEAATVSPLDQGQLPEADQYVTHIAQVKYAKPSEIAPILQGFSKIPNSIMPIDSSGILVIRDYAANVKRMLELLERIDVTVPLDYEEEVIPIKYALASDMASALGSLGGGSSTSIGSSAGGASRPATGGLGSPGSSPFGQQGGSPGGYQQPGGLGSPGAGAGAPRTTSFQDRLRSLVQRAGSAGEFQVLGQTKIIADERTNSLLVFASKQDMEMIKSIISKLDVVLAQVLIEAAIIEVTLTDNKSIGVSTLQSNPSTPGHYFSGQGAVNNGGFENFNSFNGLASGATNATSALASGLNYFGNFGGDFQATVTAMEQDSHVKVLSRPTIQTSHAVPASLQIGSTVPYVTGTYFNGVNGTPSSQYQQTFVGINLQVTPLINADGLVVMDITQDVQQLGPSTTIDGNAVPTTTKRTAQAKVSVMDGDTIELGGFISSTKSDSKSGVPLLKDIPVLGYLFRSTTAEYDRTELIVLIRPTVLKTPESAAMTARSEQRRMPSVRAAIEEDDLDRANRIKKGDEMSAQRQQAIQKDKVQP